MPFDLAEKYIAEAESKLGARLPESYRNKMLKENGGEVLIEGSASEEVWWWLHPILDSSDRKRLKRTCNDIVHETRVREGYELSTWPTGALEIGHNGFGDAFVFLRDGKVFADAIFFWDPETGSLEQVAGDFSELTIA